MCTCCAPSMTRWRLRAELRPGARLVVIGAGFIGAEVASTATKLGLDVTVVEAALAPLAGPLGVQLGAAVARLHAEHGTRLLCGAPVAGLTGSDRVTGVQLADGRRCPPTSSWSASARCPTSSGCAAARSNWPTVWCVTRAGQRRSRTWLRSATVRPGMSRVWDGHTASNIGPARWSARPSRSPRCWPADATTARRPDLPTSGPTSTTAGSSSPASPIPATRSPSRSAACAMPASWPCTAAKVNRSQCSASTSRGCSPAGVANWRAVPVPA